MFFLSEQLLHWQSIHTKRALLIFLHLSFYFQECLVCCGTMNTSEGTTYFNLVTTEDGRCGFGIVDQITRADGAQASLEVGQGYGIMRHQPHAGINVLGLKGTSRISWRSAAEAEERLYLNPDAFQVWPPPQTPGVASSSSPDTSLSASQVVPLLASSSSASSSSSQVVASSASQVVALLASSSSASSSSASPVVVVSVSGRRQRLRSSRC